MERKDTEVRQSLCGIKNAIDDLQKDKLEMQ